MTQQHHERKSLDVLNDVPPAMYARDAWLASQIEQGRKHVWHIAPPKSGSSWLSALLHEALGWPRVPLVPIYDRREQEIDLRQLFAHTKGHVFSPQQHCRASKYTLQVIDQFRMTPIIQTRRLDDSLVSLRDHLHRYRLANSLLYVDEHFLSMSDSAQLDFLVDMAAPWYFNFYLSWFQAIQSQPNQFAVCSYEDLQADPHGSLSRLLSYIGEERTDSEVERVIKAVAATDTRKNEGGVGRARAVLSSCHYDRLKRMAAYYGATDLTLIGL